MIRRRRRRLKKKRNNNKQQTKTSRRLQQQLLTTLFRTYSLLPNKIKTDNPQVANCYSRHALVTLWPILPDLLDADKKEIKTEKKHKESQFFFLLSASENTVLADLNKIQTDFERY